VGRIFKEHYNVYHTEKPKGPAAEFHFSPDARDFTQMVRMLPDTTKSLLFAVCISDHPATTVQVKETQGWNDEKLMSYQGPGGWG
jgi:hypothetical protein